jgi:3-hexulose-6-phosphate synthase
MKLQLALDLTDKKKALNLCNKIKDSIDIIELGTPFIKMHGLKNLVQDFKKFKKPILADLKTMDTGYFEAELAFKEGADYSTVCATSYKDTIKGTIKAARDYKKKSVVDLIGRNDFLKATKEIILFNPDYIAIHSGIDMQMDGIKPLKNLKQISKIIPASKISVAGGINLDTIKDIVKYKPGIIVIGGALTKSINPVKECKKFKEIMIEHV